MPIRKSPGRPGRGELPAPQRKRTVYLPLEVDVEMMQLAKPRGLSAQAAIREAVLIWLALGPEGVKRIREGMED
jgi:hypothetical protein